jgi:S1-C subfamily serine protease
MSGTFSADLSGLSQALVELVDHTSGAVVAVKAAPYRVVSGIAVRDDLIAVSEHTLKREDRVPVVSAGTETIASVVGRDPGVDLAFLRLENFKTKPLAVADVSTLKAGTLAAIVGQTIDVGPSASLGILGAVGGQRRTWRGGTLDHFFRLDVNLYPSQAGAAVVNAEGQLIGLATPALLRHSSVAVPFATLDRVAEELLREGRIRHGYLGIGLQPVTIPASLRSKYEHLGEWGLILLNVENDSPAEKAGLQVGDILLTLDKKPVTEVEELQSALRGDAVGKTVTAELLRGGEPISVNVTVSERVRTKREK